MLIAILAKREISYTRFNIQNLVRENSEALCSIPLSSLFRNQNIVSDYHTTVILGFLRLINPIIVTLHHSSIRFYDALFSRQSLIFLREKLCIFLSSDLSVLDGLLKISFIGGMQYIGVVYIKAVSGREFCSEINLHFFINGIRCLWHSIIEKTYFNRIASYAYSDGALFVSNSNVTVHFVYATGNRVQDDSINFENITTSSRRECDLQMKVINSNRSCRDRWYWCSNAVTCSCPVCVSQIPSFSSGSSTGSGNSSNSGSSRDSSSSSDTNLNQVSSSYVIIHSKRLGEEWLRQFYPAVDCTRDLVDVEIRVIGPSEDDLHVLITIGLEVQFKGASRQLAALLSFHPWIGELETLKFADLAYFQPPTPPSSTGSDSFNDSYTHTHNSTSSNGSISCFSSRLRLALDVYSNMILSSDPVLRAHYDSIETLSNSRLICLGQSLSVIRHPALPIEIYNDEFI